MEMENIRTGKCLVLLILIFSLSAKFSGGAKITHINRDYRIVAIDIGSNYNQVIPGLKLYVLSAQGSIKGIVELRRVGKFASAGKILEEFYQIQTGDEVLVFENTLIPKSESIASEKKFLLNKENFLSLLESLPSLKAVEYKYELFKGEAKKAYLKFFPSLDFQKLRGHSLQEGRRRGNRYLGDVVPEWALLYWRLPFQEIARRNYYFALAGRFELEFNKEKTELTLKFLNLLNLYILNLNKYENLNLELKELNYELKYLKEQKGIYPYLIQRLKTKILEKEKLKNVQISKIQELKTRLRLFLNLTPETELTISEPEKLFIEVKNSLFIPEGGYELLLAEYELKIKKSEAILSRLEIRPKFEYKLAYPSYVSTFKLLIPTTGLAVIKVAEIEERQASCLLEKEKIYSHYQIKRLNTELYYLRKLISRYQNFKHQVLKIKPIYWQDRLDHRELVSNLLDKINELKYNISETQLKLLRYGNVEIEPEIFVGEDLPTLKSCLKYAQDNNPELKYLQLETQKSFEFLKEAKAQNNIPKADYFQDEYVYKASLKKLRAQELQVDVVKTYLGLLLNSLDYKNSLKISRIYDREWEIKKQEKKVRAYLIERAKLAWQEALIKQIEKKLAQDLTYLDLKLLLSCVNKIELKPEVKISVLSLEEIEETILKIDFEPNLRECVEKFKVLLATDKVEIAKRGYFISSPWEIVYLPKKLPAHGRRGDTWKKIGPGVEFIDWLSLIIPTGIIYRTPFGNRIHDLRIAHTDLDIAKIKCEQAIFEQEHLRELILKKSEYRTSNLKETKKIFDELKSKYLETKSKFETFQVEESDLLASERIYLEKEIQYLNKLALSLESKLEILDYGYPERIPTKELKPLPQILTEIPKLKIVEKEAEIVFEQYKKALKSNFTDVLRIAIGRAGPWFLLKISPDINIIRANHIAKETSIWMEKANVDADLEYQDYLARVQTARAKIELKNLLLKKIQNYLKDVENEVYLGIAPYTHYIELKVLEDEVVNEIQSEKEEELYALMKLKTLMGIPPWEELIIPDLVIKDIELLKIAKPDIIINIITRDYPDVKLKESQLLLAYKEKKWDGYLRNLSFGIDFFYDFILSRTYAWNITFTVFDLYLHQLRYYYQDKIQYQNLLLGMERLNIKKEVLKSYHLLKNYSLRTKELKLILEGYREILDSAWSAYLKKEIPWGSEYGLLKVLTQYISFQNQYLDNLHEYIYNFNYYNELQKKFLSEEKVKTLAFEAPFGILTIDKLKNILGTLKDKLSLFKNYLAREKICFKNITAWEEKEQKRNFNLYIYNTRKMTQKQKLEKIAGIYRTAQETEYKTFLALEKIWAKDYQDYLILRQRLKDLLLPSYETEYKNSVEKTIKILKPEIRCEYSLFIPFNEEDIYNGLTNYFLKYLRNFRFSEKEIHLFFLYLPEIAKIWSELKTGRDIKLANFWSKYSIGLSYLFMLPFFEPEDINELGLICHYSLIAVYHHKSENPQLNTSFETLVKLKLRLRNDTKFIFLNLRTIPEKIIPGYLKWQDYIIKEIDRLTFQYFNYEEIENLRIEFAKLKVPFWEYLEGNKLEEQTQIDIIRWFIAGGGKNKEIIFELITYVPRILYRIYKEPSLKEISHCYDALRLRYLIQTQNMNLANHEYMRLKRSYMIGLILFWLNKISIEKIELQELKQIVFKIQELQNLPEFRKLYGWHSLSDERYLFYQHSLIYYAQKHLKDLNLKELKNSFAWMNFLKHEPSFICLYGQIDLSQEFLYERYPIFKLRYYLGNLTFWANWAYENKFSKDFVKRFLTLYNQSLNSSEFKYKLEEIYKKIGIDVELKLDQPSLEMKEEIMGLISNWVMYFYLRGIDSLEDMLNCLNEIKEIAELSYKNSLNYNQDDLRYWYQHRHEEGYGIGEIKDIFKIMSELKNLLIQAVEEIYHEPQLKQIISEIAPYLEVIKNKKMHKGEIQRLAEKIIYPQKIEICELIEEYKIGILIQALYYTKLNLELSPNEVTKIFDFIKKEGLEIRDLIKIVEIEKEIYNYLRDNNLNKIFTEPQLRNFIWQINFNKGWEFTEKHFRYWLPKLVLFLKEFHNEHNFYPPKRLIYAFLDYHYTNSPDWQVKRIILKGALSEEANNIIFINLGKALNIKREILFSLFSKFSLGINFNNLKQVLNYFLNYDIYQTQDFFELIKEFEENISLILHFQDKKEFLNKLQKIVTSSLPMLAYCYQNQEEFKNRILYFSEKAKDGFKEIYPEKEFQKLLKSPAQRYALIKNIKTKAEREYNLILSPARTYAIIWKLREGYNLDSAFEVFIGLYQRLKDSYREILSCDITGDINNLLLHLAQQIYLTPLEFKDCQETFSILKILKDINRTKGITIPEVELYRDAEVIYFTGLVSQDMLEISKFLKQVEGYFTHYAFEKLLYVTLRAFGSQLYHIPHLELYSYQDYLGVLKETNLKPDEFIPLLNKKRVSPSGFYYFYLQAQAYARILKFGSKFNNRILALILWEKTKDAQIIKKIFNLQPDFLIYAYLRKLNRLIDKRLEETVKKILIKECK